MKKRLLIILLVFIFCLCFNLESFAAYSDNLPTSNSSSYNLLNPEYIRKDDNGVIHYDGKIKYQDNKKYYLGIDGVITTDGATVDIENNNHGKTNLSRLHAVRFCFLLDFTSTGEIKSSETSTSEECFFTFSNLTCNALKDVSLDKLKNSMYVRSEIEGSYYTPYVDDSYTVLDKSKAIVTSTDNKLDLNEIGKKIKTNLDCTITLVNDGEYNEKYQTPGTYIVEYKVDAGYREITQSISIYVFKKAQCQITGPSSLWLEASYQFEGFYTFEEWMNSLFTATYGGREVTLEYGIFDPDSSDELKFEDIYSKNGSYFLIVFAYYEGKVVDRYQIEMVIEDDEQRIEVYFPEVLLNVTTLSSYNDIELCQELEKTLNVMGLNVDKVTLMSSEYNEDSKAGEYNIVYSYDIDGKTYINKAIINVEEDNNAIDDVIQQDSNKTLSGANIAIITICSLFSVLVLGFIIVKLKHKL